MELPRFEYCLRDDLNGNKEWVGTLQRLEAARLIGIDEVVRWTPIARAFVPLFIENANRFRERCGYPKLHFWSTQLGKFCEAQNYDFTRQKERYNDGTFRFGPFHVAEYVFQLNNREAGTGDRFLNDCLAVHRFLLRTQRSDLQEEHLILEAIIEGVRAGGNEADENWGNSDEITPESEYETENAIRCAIEKSLRRSGFFQGHAQIVRDCEDATAETPVKVMWLKGEEEKLSRNIARLRQGDIVLIVDAIDGYRMFKRHLPYWCIAVGAGRWRNNSLEAIAGVIFHPPTQEMFIGLVGSGAVLVNERLAKFQPLPPVSTARSDKSVIATHFSMEKPELSYKLLSSLLQGAVGAKDWIERILMLGSGQMALAYIAAQRLQIFTNVTTHYWNAYAGMAIVQAAFAKQMVYDIAGNHWNVASKGIVAWGGPQPQEALGEMVKQALDVLRENDHQ